MGKLVSDLTAYILASLKDEESGRVAFYHYLKNLCNPTQVINAKLINTFFAEAMQHPHWQENREALGRDITALLQRFYSQPGIVPPFTFDQLWNLPRLQLLMINQIEDLYMIVKASEKEDLADGESLRLIPDGETRMVSLRRSKDGELNVRTFNSLV